MHSDKLLRCDWLKGRKAVITYRVSAHLQVIANGVSCDTKCDVKNVEEIHINEYLTDILSAMLILCIQNLIKINSMQKFSTFALLLYSASIHEHFMTLKLQFKAE